jgi:Rrf2 family protein
MAKMLRISEAAALAMHAVVLMAADSKRPMAVGRAARRLNVSGAHLSKVLQRLSKAGLADSIRGPHGGFILAKSPGRITLLEVYEAIEGRREQSGCLFDGPGCGAPRCILGGLLERVDAQIGRYLSATRISSLADLYAGDDGDEEKHHQD